jgi:predicted TIM-barrel enzyme
MSPRERCLSRLRESVGQGIPILGVGAGTGISAKFAETGGADLIITYVFNEEEARRMADAGADLLVAHMGLTTRGTIGAKTSLTLDAAARRVQAIRDAGASVNPEVLVICHGGPIAEPEDTRFILEHTNGVHGFFGASSIERLAVERAITEQTRAFKQIRRRSET